MSERAFGIEIECGHARGSDYARQLLRDEGLTPWARDVGIDGSGVEIRSPILSGKSGFADLKEVLAVLREHNFYTGAIDGGHIHYDMPEFARLRLDFDEEKRQLASQLVESWEINQRHIERLVAQRRRNSASCPRVPASAKHRAGDVDVVVGRHALNIGPLLQYQRPHVEVRLLEGTLDYDLLSSWIKFGQRFIDNVMNRQSIPVCSSPLALLKLTRMGTRAHEALLAVR